MAFPGRVDKAEVIDVADDAEFRDFLVGQHADVLVVPEPLRGDGERVLNSSAGDLAKWLRVHAPEVKVQMGEPTSKLVLRSGDYWLPLMFLGKDVALPVFLGLITSYIYDKMKGALKNDKTRIRLRVTYDDTIEGKTKCFDFEGDADSLKKAIGRFDVNRFLDD